MHESRVARQLLDLVLEQAPGERVRAVSATITEGVPLTPDGLLSHFQALAQGTGAEQADVSLECRPMPVSCAGCDTIFALQESLTACPTCGSLQHHPLEPPSIVVAELTVHPRDDL